MCLLVVSICVFYVMFFTCAPHSAITIAGSKLLGDDSLKAKAASNGRLKSSNHLTYLYITSTASNTTVLEQSTETRQSPPGLQALRWR